ncbi:HAD-IA family hydrolase [Nonomuraea sp. NPDC003201]
MLGELGVPAERVLFVDDRPVNLASARSLGMRTVLFRSDDTGTASEPGVGSMQELVAAARAGRRPGRPGRRG